MFQSAPNDSGEVWCALVCSCPTLRWFWALFRLRVGPFAMFLSDAVDWAAHKRPYSASPTLPQRSIHDWRDPSNMHPLNSASFRDNALRLRRSTHDCGGEDLSFAAPGLAAKVWASWSSGSWDASTRCTSPIQLAWTAPLSLPHSAGADNILPRFGRGRVSLVNHSYAPFVTGRPHPVCNRHVVPMAPILPRSCFAPRACPLPLKMR